MCCVDRDRAWFRSLAGLYYEVFRKGVWRGAGAQRTSQCSVGGGGLGIGFPGLGVAAIADWQDAWELEKMAGKLTHNQIAAVKPSWITAARVFLSKGALARWTMAVDLEAIPAYVFPCPANPM